MGFRERFRNFMQGRYGTDQLSDFLLILAVILWALGGRRGKGLLALLTVVVIFILGYRILSREHTKRYRENERFLMLTGKFRRRYQKFCFLMRDRYKNRIYVCPTCGQKIRVPRGKGKIAITCPQCRTEFIRKS